MKLPLLSSTLLLWVITQVEGQRDKATCGRLGLNLIPLMTNSYTTHRWPWHIAIYHQIREKRSYQCGGSVIRSNTILTAAQCVSKYDVAMETRTVLVSLEKVNLDAAETSVPFFEVDEIVIHPNFSYHQLNDDIAIVKLSDNDFFNRNVHPVCLWESSKKHLTEVIGKEGTVISWGRTEKDQTSYELRKVSMSVVSWITCLKSNRPFAGILLTERNFCAGHRNGTSVCVGDAGGSMTFEENGIHYIRGIVSGIPSTLNRTTLEVDCDSMQYAIFTDVAQYLNWIKAPGDNQMSDEGSVSV